MPPLKVNEHHIKHYIGSMEDLKGCDDVTLAMSE